MPAHSCLHHKLCRGWLQWAHHAAAGPRRACCILHIFQIAAPQGYKSACQNRPAQTRPPQWRRACACCASHCFEAPAAAGAAGLNSVAVVPSCSLLFTAPRHGPRLFAGRCAQGPAAVRTAAVLPPVRTAGKKEESPHPRRSFSPLRLR